MFYNPQHPQLLHVGCDIVICELTLQELGDVLKELKRGKCMDPAGFIREMFINGGQMLTQSLLAMANYIKNKASTPLQWNQMYIQTLKKKNGSVRKLSNYRGIISIIILVPIISIIIKKQSYTIIGRKYDHVSDRGC